MPVKQPFITPSYDMMKTLATTFLLFALSHTHAQGWFSTGQTANLMLSGVDFNNTGGAMLFNHPSGLASDGTRFLLCDRFNNRILVWNTLPDHWDSPPDLVLGQPDMISNNPGTGKHQLNWAGNASLGSNGKLAVADTENDRILLWNSFPAANAEPADVSLHLPLFTLPGTPVQYGWPWGVWTDGNRLAAVATSGAAILFWNTFPLADNTPPDYIVHLPEFGTPRNISTDGSTYFFVGDHNAKVNNGPGTFFWNAYPSQADQPFDFYRDEWIKGERLPSGQLVAAGLSSIYIWDAMPQDATADPDLTLKPSMYKNGDGVDAAFCGNRLYINNYNGNNVLVYNDLPVSPGQLPDFALGAPGITAQTLDSIGYIQNPVLTTDGTRLIATSDFDRAINIWNTLPLQSGQKPDQRILTPPNVQIWASALYGNKFVVAGRKSVSVWNDAAQLGPSPSVIFNNTIGNATFTDLSGVALDGQFFYLADKSGVLYIWNGIPSSGNQDPAFTISTPGVQYGFLHSDGQYLCAVRPEPPSTVYVFKVAELATGNTTPCKTIVSSGQVPLNQATQAITFDGALAVSSRGNHAVLLWEHVDEAGDPAKMITLGQPAAGSFGAAIGPDRLFMPASLMAQGNNLWVGEFKFSSRILKFSHSLTAVGDLKTPEEGFAVFPNPASGRWTIHCSEIRGQAADIRVFDMSGKLKYTGAFDTSFPVEIPLEGWAAGAYEIWIVSSKGQWRRTAIKR